MGDFKSSHFSGAKKKLDTYDLLMAMCRASSVATTPGCKAFTVTLVSVDTR